MVIRLHCRKEFGEVMLRVSNIKMPVEHTKEQLFNKALKKLGLKSSDAEEIKINKRSISARRKDDIHYIYSVDVKVKSREERYLKIKDVSLAEEFKLDIPQSKLYSRPIVIGAGPAGLFAALILARAGAKPIVYERGASVSKRKEMVENFLSGGELSVSTNIQFGEGGAGTFSDGKLGTGIKNPYIKAIYEELYSCGAPEEILYEAHPHVGTDMLCDTIINIRKKIESLGGEIFFETCVTDINIEKGAVRGITLQNGDVIECDKIILAIGHSARDTFEMLYNKNVEMTQKPFAVGVRIEHLQSTIDRAQYGECTKLPPAEYKLAVKTSDGVGVYTFCMCPGGYVVGATSECGQVVTNGMSNHLRNGENSNSALLVGVHDFKSDHVLAGMYFQREIEKAAFVAGGGNYYAPVQRVEDFLNNKVSDKIGKVKPTYRPGYKLSQVDDYLPKDICDSLREGIVLMDKKIRGFADSDAILTGVESRSSSPVRIVRDEKCVSVNVKGLYPCGEGAGYAGGITSSAADGIKCALSILEEEV